MKPMLDILKEDDFRNSVEAKLKKADANYCIPQTIPPLYKYSSFSKYAIENIIKNTISISLIASFNDSFDSTMSYGNIRKKAIEEYEWDKAFHAYYGENPLLTLEEYQERFSDLQNTDKEFLRDKYCLCLSECNSSVLMWSHYANNNKGICVEYDFETIKDKNPLYYSLLPMIYTSHPINVYNYTKGKYGTYSIETGLVISLLNKSEVWKYEHEWRLFILDLGYDPRNIYINLEPDVISAKRIILGCNFLDNFFEELSSNQSSTDTMQQLKQLVEYAKKKSIPISIMKPLENSFELSPQTINNVGDIYNFIKTNIDKNRFTLNNRHMLYTKFSQLIAKQSHPTE